MRKLGGGAGRGGLGSSPEVHMIGNIVGGHGFTSIGSGISCRFSVSHGSSWTLLSGRKDGQSHFDAPAHVDGAGSGASGVAQKRVVWCHPFDLHFSTTSMAGYPSMLFQIWTLDKHGRTEICAYGHCPLPTLPGDHTITASTWRPKGTHREEISAYFVGGKPRLTSDAPILSNAKNLRSRLSTASSGTVEVQISVVMRNFSGMLRE